MSPADPRDLDRLVGSYGIYPWFPEHGTHFIKESDLAGFAPPGVTVFKCVGIESPWLVLEYEGTRVVRVLPDRYQRVPAPSFSIGDSVLAQSHGVEKPGEVAAIYWHFKKAELYYYVSFDGRRSGRRYAASELSISHAPTRT